MAQSKQITVLIHNQAQGDHVTLPESVNIVGERYEDVYGGYMAFFERIAKTQGKVIIENAPCSWIPLLTYLNATVIDPVDVFEFCPNVFAAWHARDTIVRHPNEQGQDLRTVVEALSAFRPECVDALWKIDRQWKVEYDRKPHPVLFAPRREFIVTGNGSFDRPEVREYERELANYIPDKDRVILLPCAADKPYPSKLHATVIAMLEEEDVRDQWYIANATGVLGVVPEDLWPVMPYYDSGIPNRWNLMKVATDYFSTHHHEAVVTYMDFYGQAFDKAFELMGEDVIHVNAPAFYADYLDLLDEKRLERLRAVIRSNSRIQHSDDTEDNY